MDIATTIEASASAVGVLCLLAGGVFSAGKFKAIMDANTKSNEKLANVIDGHLIWAQQQVDDAREKFNDHEVRISVVEARLEK